MPPIQKIYCIASIIYVIRTLKNDHKKNDSFRRVAAAFLFLPRELPGAFLIFHCRLHHSCKALTIADG
nr:MAG TPA: hypothetical protein [Caudoviricetes sp.]